MWEISSLNLATLQLFSTLSLLAIFAGVVFTSLWVLLYCKICWRSSLSDAWIGAYRFWVRFFALSLTICFSVSIPLLLQVGTVWPTLLMKIVAIVGPLLSFGVLLAFVTKLFFLNAMLYRQGKMAEWLHTLAVFCSAIGFTAVLYVVLVMVSWMANPVGSETVNGIEQVVDWLAILSQKQIFWRFMAFLACGFITHGFLMMGISAWQAGKHPLNSTEKLSFKIGVVCAVLGLFVIGSLFIYYYFVPTISIVWPQNYFMWLIQALILLMLLLTVYAWFYLFKFKRDVNRMSAWMRRCFSAFTFVPAFVGFSLLMVIGYRSFPYLVGHQIMLQDVFRDPGFWPLVFSTLAYFILYAALLFGMVQMLYHAARFGVVPVRKIRRTA